MSIDVRQLLATVEGGLFVGAAALAFDAVTLDDYSGAEIFDRFCASCHGTEARGEARSPGR